MFRPVQHWDLLVVATCWFTCCGIVLLSVYFRHLHTLKLRSYTTGKAEGSWTKTSDLNSKNRIKLPPPTPSSSIIVDCLWCAIMFKVHDIMKQSTVWPPASHIIQTQRPNMLTSCTSWTLRVPQQCCCPRNVPYPWYCMQKWHNSCHELRLVLNNPSLGILAEVQGRQDFAKALRETLWRNAPLQPCRRVAVSWGMEGLLYKTYERK